MSDRMLSARQSLAETMQMGVGMRPDRRVLAAREGLTREERRRVGRLVRDGRPAWDVPSARYAVEVARARMRIPVFWGTKTNRRLYTAMALLFVVDGVGKVAGHGHVLAGIWQLVLAVVFAYFAVTNANLHGGAAVSLRRNELLLEEAAAEPLPRSRFIAPSWRRQLVGALLSVMVMGLAVAVGIELGGLDSGGTSLRNALVAGFLFAVGYVVVMRGFMAWHRHRRRGRRPPPAR